MTLATHKHWERRIASYEAGAPIPKSRITALQRIVREGIYPTFLLHWAESIQWAITPEQTDQGLEWLTRKAIHKALPPEAQQVLSTFLRFLFVGFTFIDGWPHPVYRVIGAGNSWFDYTAWPGAKAARILGWVHL